MRGGPREDAWSRISAPSSASARSRIVRLAGKLEVRLDLGRRSTGRQACRVQNGVVAPGTGSRQARLVSSQSSAARTSSTSARRRASSPRSAAYVAEGLAVGMKGGEGAVRRASQDLAGSTVPAFGGRRSYARRRRRRRPRRRPERAARRGQHQHRRRRRRRRHAGRPWTPRSTAPSAAWPPSSAGGDAVPKVTVRPTKQDPNYKRIAVTGAGGNATTAVSDQSDATYVRRKVDGAPTARFRLATPAVPAGHDIATIVPGARLRQPTSRPPKLVTLAMSVPGTGKPKNKITPTVNGPAVRAGSGTAAYTFATPAAAGRAWRGPTRAVERTGSGSSRVRVNDGHKAERRQPCLHLRPVRRRVLRRPADRRARDDAGDADQRHVVPGDQRHVLGARRGLAGQRRRAGPHRGRLRAQAVQLARSTSPAASTRRRRAAVWSTQGLTAPLDYGDGADAVVRAGRRDSRRRAAERHVPDLRARPALLRRGAVRRLDLHQRSRSTWRRARRRS